MLRITNFPESKPIPNDSPLTNSERVPIDFHDTLSKIKVGQHRELQDFLNRLENLGNKLVETLSVKDFTEFRETVRTFLRSTLGQSRQMSLDSFWDRNGRPKKLARMSQINKALDDLGQQFIAKNTKPLEILAKIGEIRGLIIDLFA